MYTHKAHHSGEIYDFSIFVAFFRPSVVFKRGAFWSAPFSEKNLLYWIQNIFQSQLLTPKIEKVMPGQKSPFLNYHLSNEIHMTLVRKVCPFLEAKSAVAQLSEFFELGSDIKMLELHFHKCAPKVCAPRRHMGCPQISEDLTKKSDFRRFSCMCCAVWVHILGRALFVR